MKTRQGLLVTLLITVFSVNSFAESTKVVTSALSVMNKARVYFSKGELDKALSEYEKVPKSSDFWLESIEEKAHVMGRKKEYAKALALLQTPLSSAFVGLTGPEPYFVAALTHLKICDYSSIFKISSLFKERFKERVIALSQLKNPEGQAVIQDFINRIANKPFHLETLGALVKTLPRNLPRDQVLQDLSKVKKSSNRDTAIQSRILKLAKADLNEIEDILNKLQILEAEVIHRIHLADKNNSKREKQGDFKKGKDVMSFPYSGEVWLDELDNYATRVEKCSELQKQAVL